MTDSWYSENTLLTEPPADESTLRFAQYRNFTALVWVGAVRVGFGYAVKDNGENVDLYVVARFSPLTNVFSSFVANVLPAGTVYPGGWYAGGNMTDYMAPIWGFIDAAIDDDLDETGVAKNISDSCNAEWEDFWNVVVFWLQDINNNAIIYGYAFRRHWFWVNNYRENRQSFLIWKDYNCVTPLELNDGSASVESGDFSALFQPMLVSNSALATDIWAWGQTIVQTFLQFVANSNTVSTSEIGMSGVFLNGHYNKRSVAVCAFNLEKVSLGTHSFTSPTTTTISYVWFTTRFPEV